MTNLLQRLRGSEGEQRHSQSMSFQDYLAIFGGHQYPLVNQSWTTSGGEESVTSFEGYGSQLLQGNPIVFGAHATRMAVFSQTRMVWQRRSNGKVVDTFTDRRLQKFQRPWAGGTTSDLLGRMLLHADLSGNAFVRDGGTRLHLLRPDWVTIVLGSDMEPDNPQVAADAEVAGYVYRPPNGKPQTFGVDEIAHFAPHADPAAMYRGMSWLTPVVREVQGDRKMTEHKLKFLDNAATPNLLVNFDRDLSKQQVEDFRDLFEEDHAGWRNAYKTLFLGGGADATVIGSDLQQLDFSRVQGKAETRILMAAGVHPTIAGASEGMQGSSLNAGNYNSAKRSFSDIRLQHLWINAAASLSVLEPTGDPTVELWFDKSEIPFLQDDLKDVAEIQQKQASAIRSYTEAGYEPGSVVEAVNTQDLTKLRHTGVFSVQLQPPENGQNEGAEDE